MSQINASIEKLGKEPPSEAKAATPTSTETKSPSSDTKAATEATKQPAGETKSTESGTEATAGKEAASDAATTERGADPKVGRVSPWKVVDEWKAKAATLEKQLAEAKTTSLAEQERKDYLSRLEKTEARLKEYEDEIRFTNYQKSQEFQEKYQKPYEQRFKLAMDDLKELAVALPDGSQRGISANDLLDLMNLPLPKARELANQVFGDFADDVMAHRKDLRRMVEEQSQVLEDAKTNAGAREKERMEKITKLRSEMDTDIKQTWTAANDEAAKDEQNGRFFSTKEGDDEWNTSLDNGRRLAASVFTEDPNNPKLTADERKAVVRRHAAVYNRAAAYGPMKRLVGRLEKENADLRKKVDGFTASKPDAATNGGSASAPTTPVRRMGQLMAGIGALAKD